jgi:hypothetical protein
MEFLLSMVFPLIIKFLLPKGVDLLEKALEDQGVQKELLENIKKIIPNGWLADEIFSQIKQYLPSLIKECIKLVASNDIKDLDGAANQVVASMRNDLGKHIA